MSASSAFLPVSRHEPCLICGKGDWCRRTADGAQECHRIDEASVNGFERVAKTPAGFAVYRRAQDVAARIAKENGSRNFGKWATAPVDFAAEDRNFRTALPAERKKSIAKQLGVTAAALDAIGIGQANGDGLRRLRASGAGWKENFPSVVSSFPESDASGAIVGFCLRTDDGRKGSPSRKVGGRRGLINPTTLPARLDPVLLVEGPTDVAACDTLGLASVGRPSNISGGRHIGQLLVRRKVLVVGENDRNPAGTWPGRDGAKKLAQYLAATWKRAVPWALPSPGHKDVRACLQHLVVNGLDLGDERACHEAGQQFLKSLLASATEEQPPLSPPAKEREDVGARDALLQLCADAGDHFFHDNENRAFVLVREQGIARTLRIKSRQYELLLGRRYYRITGSGLPTSAKTEAISTLEGLAIYDGSEEPVFVRLGEYGGKVVLDLCDDRWQVVVIDKNGWEVVPESPIRFRRTRGMLPLPAPARGGSINDLRSFINVRSESDFVLICAFILVCFNPQGPFIILLANGEAGSAKSTLCRLARAVIDPNKAPLRSEPKDNRDLAIAANNAWMTGLDNMSQVSERLSNALCRLATGGGFATRELYTDEDEVIFDAKRPVMINGIGDIADRSDLLDRAIRVTLSPIPENQRRTEKEIWEAFKERQPFILGAFLDAVSVALRDQASVKLTKLPRMADGASWVVAAERACPWAPGMFLAVFDDQRRAADEFVIEASPLAAAVRNCLEHHGNIEGTATQVLQLLSADTDESVLKDPAWPKRAPEFGTRLREVAPNLRRIGIEVQFDRSGTRRTIRIRRNQASPETPSSPSQPSPAGQEDGSGASNHGLGGQGSDGDGRSCDGSSAIDDGGSPPEIGQKQDQ